MRSVILCLVFQDPSLEILAEEAFTSQRGTKEQFVECKPTGFGKARAVEAAVMIVRLKMLRLQDLKESFV